MLEAPSPVAAIWDTSALQGELRALLAGSPGLSGLQLQLQVQVLAQVDSTNTRLLEQARNAAKGAPTACLLVALEQTAGRGRLGRAWQSSPGASLTFSLGLPLAPLSWSGLSLAVGLALADALDPAPAAGTPPRIGLKWPNDLWLWDGPGQGRKLGGILIETVAVGQQRVCVIGVGLNVASQPVPGASAGSACLQELDPGATPATTLQRIAGPLLQAVLLFARQGFSPLTEAYSHRDLLRGQPVLAIGAGAGAGAGEGKGAGAGPGTGAGSKSADLAGVAEGVDADGALCLRVGEGRGAVTRRIVSGEVSVRLRAGAGAC